MGPSASASPAMPHSNCVIGSVEFRFASEPSVERRNTPPSLPIQIAPGRVERERVVVAVPEVGPSSTFARSPSTCTREIAPTIRPCRHPSGRLRSRAAWLQAPRPLPPNAAEISGAAGSFVHVVPPFGRRVDAEQVAVVGVARARDDGIDRFRSVGAVASSVRPFPVVGRPPPSRRPRCARRRST